KKHFISRSDVRLISDGQFSNTMKYSDIPPLTRAQAAAQRHSLLRNPTPPIYPLRFSGRNRYSTTAGEAIL
ncbi:MAG: hypothetical protein D3924_18690, partial [Candidatus Electrothrix sp. AR4]|nr:hypothetical protein [Candidatus Electrothrix sp. AR4]